MQTFKFVQSDEESNAEFSMVNSDDLEDSDYVSNEPVMSTIIDKLYFLMNSFMKCVFW